MYTRLKGIAQR